MKAFFLMFLCFLLLAIVVATDKQKRVFAEKASAWFSPAKKFEAGNYLAITGNDRLLPVVKERYGQMIRSICRAEKVNPALRNGEQIEKIIIIESSANPDARKANDGYGLMGVKRSTAVACGVDPDSLFIPYWNLLAGIRFLNSLVGELDGNVPAAIVAYNCGLQGYRNNYAAGPGKSVYYQKVKILTEAEKRLALDD